MEPNKIDYQLKAIKRCLEDLDSGEQPHIVHYAILCVLGFDDFNEKR